MAKSDNKLINDSGLTIEQVDAILENSVEIHYGALAMRIERRAIDDARRDITTMSSEERQTVRASVIRALDRNVPKILAGKYTKKRCDDMMGDLVLWHVLTGN